MWLGMQVWSGCCVCFACLVPMLSVFHLPTNLHSNKGKIFGGGACKPYCTVVNSLQAKQSTHDDFLWGRIVIDENFGILFSHDITEHLKKLLVSLVQEFRKQRVN